MVWLECRGLLARRDDLLLCDATLARVRSQRNDAAVTRSAGVGGGDDDDDDDIRWRLDELVLTKWRVL